MLKKYMKNSFVVNNYKTAAYGMFLHYLCCFYLDMFVVVGRVNLSAG